MKHFTLSLFALTFSLTLCSQPHLYLDEVFDGIEYTPDIPYAVNATILYLEQLGQAVPQTLSLDLYEPEGDTASLRPLIIYFHSGNFIPYPYNLNVNGTKLDSSVVEMCRRLARSGFVVASAEYRQGWNPYHGDESVRTTGIINAAYRGVQDANTCIRYFKKTAVEDGNPFRIDTSRIVLFGDDTGGYITVHASALDDYDKIPNASDGKFLIPTGDPDTPFVAMIREDINGDVEGKHVGVMTDPFYQPFFPYPIGDTLCYSNYPEYSSSFSASVNLAGGIADTAWIDAGQPPIICVHTTYDSTTPYKEGYVYVGGVLRVIEVQGSYLITYVGGVVGNTDQLVNPWDVPTLTFDPTGIANQRNNGIEGLLPVIGDTISDTTPWVFWDPETNINSDEGFKTNPRMSRAKAELYMDTILAYVLPRIYAASNMWELTSTQKIIDPTDMEILTYPNPATTEIFIATHKDSPIRSISVFDLRGVLSAHIDDIDDNYYYLNVKNLIAGQYTLLLEFDQGVAARQVIVN